MTDRQPVTIQTTAERLHAAYCAEMAYSPDEVPLSMASLYAWELFAAAFTPDDLRALIRHIRKKGRMARSLQPRHLITGPNSIDFAHEDLAEAKAMGRTRPPTARQEILRVTGRPQETTQPAKPIAEVLKGEELKAFFAKCKQEAGLI